MECSIKEQKIQAMKNYNRAKFVCNFVLYSVTSIITCFFFSYPFRFPSMNHFLSSLPNINVSFFLNAKCFFVVGNLIVIILVGESKLKQSSSSWTSDIYDEYVARSRSSHHNINSKEMNGYMNIGERKHGKEEKIYHEEKKKEVRVCKSTMPHEEKKKGMRTSKSEVWGESGIVKGDKTKGKKEEFYKSSINHEEKKMGMRSCKSEVWGESEIVKREKTKGKKQEEIYKSSMNHEEKKMGMRSCKSEVWGENEIVKREKTKGKKEEEIYKSSMNHEEKNMGMRSCKSEVWGESEIVEMEKTKGKEAEQHHHMPSEELNKRVEAFIARVNKQRLLEAKLVDHGRC